MRKSQKGCARSDARAEDANPFVLLSLQPRDGRTCIDHCLTHRLKRATDIRAHQVVSSFDFGWSSLFVIGHRQTERGDAEPVENAAGFHVTLRLSIPLRQHDDRCTRLARPPRFDWKKPRPGQVVFNRWRMNRTGPG